MESYFDKIAKVLGSGLSRRETLGLLGGALLGTLGLGGRSGAGHLNTGHLTECLKYCSQFKVPREFIACRNTCLTCPSTASLCGSSGLALRCCGSGQKCQNNTCVANSTCTDGKKNGNETDVDCGGGTCDKCGTGKRCRRGSDCQSGICTNRVCQAPPVTCSDEIKNGTETDVDCGGTVCPKCANGKFCASGTDCVSGICSSGVCQADLCQGVTCTALDQCHVAGTCDPSTGMCSNPTKADGTACDDGNACTTADSCQAGVCVGTPRILDDGNPCTIDTCDPESGVVTHTNAPDGTACDDGDACTQNDVCQAGMCVGSPVACNPVANATGGVCHPRTGICDDYTCNDSFGNCNNNFADGCETNLNTDPYNCGFCGNVCDEVCGVPLGACVNGTCNYDA